MRPILVVAALLVAAATAGCGSASTATPPAPVISTEALDLVRQAGGYAAGQDAITRAEGRLVARCMTAAGLRYVVDDKPSPATATATDYGLYATHVGKQADPSANRATNDYYLARLPDAERAAYLEVLRSADQAAVQLSDGRQITYSTRGCESAARVSLFGDLETQVKVYYVPQIVNKPVQKQVQQDPRYLAATAVWSSCMASGGAPYPSPADARKHIGELYEKTGPTAETHRREIAVATLDRSCATKAQLPAIEATIARSVLTALPEPDQRELNRLADVWRKSVDIARSTP
ncbi:hypothetical protein [Actinoplanes sp. GCM10030250]|uniref:hypothetical protein n=1 Tax=Actinoplanes sp. GCM10030250 TaxID=3273376 RepID=UPI0036170F27